MNLKKCPDCGGEFEDGCLIDQTYGAVTVQRYAKSEIVDDKKLVIGTTEQAFEDLRKTAAYRCKECNRLFLYALPTVQVRDLRARMNNVWIVFLIVGIIALGIIFSFAL